MAPAIGESRAIPTGADPSLSEVTLETPVAPSSLDPALDTPDSAAPTLPESVSSRRLRFRAAPSATAVHGGGGFGDRPIAAVTGDVDGSGRFEVLATYAVASIAGGFAISTFFFDAHGLPIARFDTSAPGASGPIASGDFDGDGQADLAVIDTLGDRVDIYLSRSNGHAFAAAPPVVVANGMLVGLAAGDLDGDGADDLVVSDATGSLVIELATGDGAFELRDRRALGTRPDAVTLADLDGNGTLDVAVVIAPEVAVLRNHGSARFGRTRRFSVGGTAGPLVAADVDGDGARDLVLSPGGVGLTVLRNEGDARFVPGPPQPMLSPTQLLFAGDLDRDGTDDVYAGNDRAVTILLGHCHDRLRVGPSYSATSVIATGDLNGDGCIDVAALRPSFAPGALGFIAGLIAQHDGTLWAARLFPQALPPIAQGDFDHDTREDFLLLAPDRFDLWTARAMFSGRPPALAIGANQPLGSAVVGHFDHNRTLDFAYGSANGIQIVLGEGHGRFSPGMLNPSSTDVDARGHFSGSRADDLVIDQGAAILPNDGHGDFGALIATGAHPGLVTVGDFDGDGHDDIAVAAGPFIDVVLGHGDGTFSAPIENDLRPLRSTGVWSGDFDGDGRDDLVLALDIIGPDVAVVTVLQSTGDGHFGSSLGSTSTGYFDARAVAAVGDFNRDGVADLAAGFSSRIDMLAGHRGAQMTLDASYRIDGKPTTMFAGDVDGDGRGDVSLVVPAGIVWLRNVTR